MLGSHLLGRVSLPEREQGQTADADLAARVCQEVCRRDVQGFGQATPFPRYSVLQTAGLRATGSGRRVSLALVPAVPFERVNDAFTAPGDRSVAGKTLLELDLPG
jgi:hypothetical protein